MYQLEHVEKVVSTGEHSPMNRPLLHPVVIGAWCQRKRSGSMYIHQKISSSNAHPRGKRMSISCTALLIETALSLSSSCPRVHWPCSPARTALVSVQAVLPRSNSRRIRCPSLLHLKTLGQSDLRTVALDDIKNPSGSRFLLLP